MFGSKYVIWIEFSNGDEGYFYKIKDGKIFYKYNPYDAKIYNSTFECGFDEGYCLNSFRDIIDKIEYKKL